MSRQAWLVLALAPLALAGCLFRDPPAPRFFAPASAVLTDGAADDPAPTSVTGVPIRLRTVHGIPFLRERIVWRLSPVEYGQYERRLWRELPARYVQRALAATLRRTPGVRLTDDPKAAALAIEVLAFDETLAPTHAATVSVGASLRDGHGRSLLERTFTAEAPIAGDDPAAMATAMGRALDAATAAVATATAAAVR